MKVATLLVTSALAALALTAASADAATLLTQGAPTGELASPGSVGFSFTAGAGTGLASFDVIGYRSLDGVNCCTDVFTFSLNGTDILSGSWDLGGGGSNVTYFAPLGSSVSATTFGMWNGGAASISVPLALLTGTNTLNFRYDGAAQGTGDEAWGLANLSVTGPSGAVPEPATWALLIAGFGLVGLSLRRRTKAVAA